ncbi:hypothetical protein AKJ37_01740 [candidate division MSBL1 archaeon SCGC-AAA259I09]|uniref:CARDB domain-containing protein n=1 Tax=candidate division MSBL1 archaeon SCGC-AAA259I09 TaxID=1698267 RepID=A0A133UV19_9EURY|nr:hypothetical protein AKJ37_01740 [candidate division MSBL1 archaeon SCGC-AAA259I09]
MPRIGKFLPLMLVLIPVVAIFMFGLIPSSHASSDFDNFKAKTDVRYSVKIDENHRTVTVGATFENLEEDSFRMSFLRGSEIYKNSDINCTILDSDEPVSTFWNDGGYGWEMDIGSDNKIFVKYKIKNLDSVGPFTSTYFSQRGEVIFAIPPHPEEEKFDRKNEVLVHLTVPENWTALGSGIWEKLDNYTFLARNLYELQRVHVPVAAADVRWEEKEKYYGIKTVFFVEETPEEKKEKLETDWAFSHQFDLNIRKDVKLISKRGAFAMNYFSEKWNVDPPRRMFISSLGLGGKAGFHYDFPWREQMEHDLGQFFIPSTGYFTQYLDSKVAAKYSGENRFLGKIYAMYLTYERGLKDRLKEGVEGIDEDIHELSASTVYERIKGYGYVPIILQYLNGRIKEETNGDKSLHDVLRRVLDNRFYLAGMPGLSAGLGDPRFLGIIKEVAGIDFSDFFEEHVSGDYEIPVDKYEIKYRDDFGLQVDYFRRYNEAPPILYYAYIEIAANVGVPEYYFYQAPTLVKAPEGSQPAAVRFFEKFLVELSRKDHVSKSEFVKILNRFTDNSSDDFFEFYSEYAPIEPNIEAVNWWLEGNYDQIVRKKIYAEKALEKISAMVSETSRYENKLEDIRTLLEDAENLLNIHQLEESLSKYRKAIEKIHWIREEDDDEDGLPDIYETSYELDPEVEDSDDDGIVDKREVRTIKLNGFAQEWQNLNPKTVEETEGIIEKIETVRTENYVNIRVKYSKPLYTLKNSQINFDFDFNQDWTDDSDRYSFELGSPNVPIEGSLDSSLENYVYVGDQNLEFKIPIETLEILRFPEKASLRVYIRSDLEGPEFGDGWDTELGSGQIDNVKILEEYEENDSDNFRIFYQLSLEEPDYPKIRMEVTNVASQTEFQFGGFGGGIGETENLKKVFREIKVWSEDGDPLPWKWKDGKIKLTDGIPSDFVVSYSVDALNIDRAGERSDVVFSLFRPKRIFFVAGDVFLLPNEEPSQSTVDFSLPRGMKVYSSLPKKGSKFVAEADLWGNKLYDFQKSLFVGGRPIFHLSHITEWGDNYVFILFARDRISSAWRPFYGNTPWEEAEKYMEKTEKIAKYCRENVFGPLPKHKVLFFPESEISDYPDVKEATDWFHHMQVWPRNSKPQIAHHFIHQYVFRSTQSKLAFGDVPGEFWSEGLATYLQQVVSTEAFSENYHRGRIFEFFFFDERGRKFGIRENPSHGYNISALKMYLLDRYIKRKTDNRKSLLCFTKKLWSRVENIREPRHISGETLSDILEKVVSGSNKDYLSKLANKKSFNRENFEILLPYFKSYVNWVSEEYFWNNKLLFLAYLDIASAKSWPHGATMRFHFDYFKEKALTPFKKYLKNLNKQNFSRKDIINALEAATDNDHSGFFEFWENLGYELDPKSLTPLRTWNLQTEKLGEFLSSGRDSAGTLETEHYLAGFKQKARAILDRKDDDGEIVIEVSLRNFDNYPPLKEARNALKGENITLLSSRRDKYSNDSQTTYAAMAFFKLKSSKEKQKYVFDLKLPSFSFHPLFTVFDFPRTGDPIGELYFLHSIDPIKFETEIKNKELILPETSLENETFEIDTSKENILLKPGDRWAVPSDVQSVEIHLFDKFGFLRGLENKALFSSFNLKKLSIDKKVIKPKEPVTVTIDLINTGAVRGDKTVELKVNEKITERRTVTLLPGESKTIEFTILKEKEGTYEVTIGEMSKSFEVKKAVKPAEFEVSNLNLSKEKVKQGETTTAFVKVTNTGGKKGTYTAKLSIDGKVKTQSVTLKPDESEKVTFKISSEKAGTYQVKIGELSKTLNVRTPEKAGKGLPWALIGGIIVVVIAVSAFILYKRE